MPCEELIRELRGGDVEGGDLRDAIAHAEEAPVDDARVRVHLPFRHLQWGGRIQKPALTGIILLSRNRRKKNKC